MSVNYRAAWVPDMEDDGELPSSLAVEWIECECADQGAGGLLITPTMRIYGCPLPIQDFAQRHDHVSPRSRRRFGGDGPVLSFVPDMGDLDFAAGRVRRSSLCVVERLTLQLGDMCAIQSHTCSNKSHKDRRV